MSAVIDNTRFTATSNIAGLMPMVSTTDVVSEIPFPVSVSKTATILSIELPEFNSKFQLPIIDVNFSRANGIYELKTALIEGALLVLKMIGMIDEEENKFLVRQVSISIIFEDVHPLPEFVGSTFGAMLPLAGVVSLKIPEIEFNLTTKFNFPLKELSNKLQLRQIAYRAMVIEKALGIEIALPQNLITGEEIENLSFIYYMIVKRTFDWPCLYLNDERPANQESLLWLPPDENLASIEFPPIPIKRNLFGNEINLGQAVLKIEESIIENYFEVKRDLSLLDGHIVNLLIRPLNGRVRIEALDAPRLLENSWSTQIQQLIDLDLPLSNELARRYCELAASTLDGLSEEEKNAVTTRTEIDEDAFLFEE